MWTTSCAGTRGTSGASHRTRIRIASACGQTPWQVRFSFILQLGAWPRPLRERDSHGLSPGPHEALTEGTCRRTPRFRHGPRGHGQVGSHWKQIPFTAYERHRGVHAVGCLGFLAASEWQASPEVATAEPTAALLGTCMDVAGRSCTSTKSTLPCLPTSQRFTKRGKLAKKPTRLQLPCNTMSPTLEAIRRSRRR